MKETTIKAVEMVRRIRDAHYEQLRGKRSEEWITFYRTKSRELRAKLAAQRTELPANEPQTT